VLGADPDPDQAGGQALQEGVAGEEPDEERRGQPATVAAL
jgi:hypothetical protein